MARNTLKRRAVVAQLPNLETVTKKNDAAETGERRMRRAEEVDNKLSGLARVNAMQDDVIEELEEDVAELSKALSARMQTLTAALHDGIQGAHDRAASAARAAADAFVDLTAAKRAMRVYGAVPRDESAGIVSGDGVHIRGSSNSAFYRNIPSLVWDLVWSKVTPPVVVFDDAAAAAPGATLSAIVQNAFALQVSGQRAFGSTVELHCLSAGQSIKVAKNQLIGFFIDVENTIAVAGPVNATVTQGAVDGTTTSPDVNTFITQRFTTRHITPYTANELVVDDDGNYTIALGAGRPTVIVVVQKNATLGVGLDIRTLAKALGGTRVAAEWDNVLGMAAGLFAPDMIERYLDPTVEAGAAKRVKATPTRTGGTL